MERGPVEWNYYSGTVEWNSGMVEWSTTTNDPIPYPLILL
jgi:hypothetical protein